VTTRAARWRAGRSAALVVGLFSRAAWSAVDAGGQQGPVPWPTVPGVGPPETTPPAPAPPPAPAAPVPAPPPALAPASPAQPAPAAPPPPPPSPIGFRPTTSLGAWGQGQLTIDRDRNVSAALPWLVATLEHRPASWLRFYAALELDRGTDLGMEQVFLEAAPHPAFGVRAGLLLLPLGIINQWHVPTTFLTVDRPLTDLLIIPTTWRELGASVFGAIGRDARYELQLVAGLDGAGFSAAAPLWGGRVLAPHDPAFVGRLEVGRATSGLAIGAGGTWGGATGGHPELAGVDVGVAEADARFRGAGLDLRAEVAELYIVNSYRVNDYLGLLAQDAVPARGHGFYAQAGYDVLDQEGPHQQLIFFAGYENVQPRSQMSPYNFNYPTITPAGQLPPNAPTPAKAFVRGGIDYRPHPAIAFKADVQVALDGEGAAPAPPMTLAGAPGTPRALRADVAEAARGRTRVGFALAFGF
jgi:hypothetical protein